ncbi:MAG: hypothetical protein K2X38_08165 [Gemmataceae bacterium]|nr:hypothetical protein [Gemmataceae bacterium]
MQNEKFDPASNATPDTTQVEEELEMYIQGLDHTLIAESLKLTVEERIRKAQSFHRSIEIWRGAANRQTSEEKGNGS